LKAWGAAGDELSVTLADAGDVHPAELVTLKVYVFGGRLLIVPVVPLPVIVLPSGALVTVQFPEAGNPVNDIEPVDVAQVGCVIAPTIGADRFDGPALIITFADDVELHPAALVTVNV
jgi:hypothetical protein